MFRRLKMSEVTPNLLGGLSEPVRLVDADDEILGYYEPRSTPVANGFVERLNLKVVTPERLAGLQDPVIIVDDAGNQIGDYLPQPDPSDWGKYIEELSPEERDRRVQAGGRPLADFLAELDL